MMALFFFLKAPLTHDNVTEPAYTTPGPWHWNHYMEFSHHEVNFIINTCAFPAVIICFSSDIEGQTERAVFLLNMCIDLQDTHYHEDDGKLFFQTHWIVSSPTRPHFHYGRVQNTPWEVDTELLSKYQTAEPNYAMQPPSGASI